jgi:hypothetical protein
MVWFTSVIEQAREKPPNNACSGLGGTRREKTAVSAKAFFRFVDCLGRFGIQFISIFTK